MLSTSQPRRMALVPLPMPGESFASWLDAVARDNGCGQDAILIRGWKVRTNPVSSINRLNMSLTGKEIRHISAATGMAHDDLAALCMSRYTDKPIPALVTADDSWSEWATRTIQRYFVPFGHSRWCPMCIRENGGRWFLRWRLSWSFACVDHNVFLSASCPSCLQAQDRGRGPVDRRLFCATLTRPEQSLRRYSNVYRCGQSLTDISATPVTDPRLLAIQRWINFGFGEGPRPAGKSARRLFFFPLLVKAILQLRMPEMFRDADPAVRAAHERDDAELPFDGPLADDATHPMLMAGALHLADQLISGDDRKTKAVAGRGSLPAPRTTPPGSAAARAPGDPGSRT